MKWDQIERKWEEMARRVQPLCSLPSTGQDKPSKVGQDGSSAKGPVASTDLFANALVAKTYE